MKNTIITFLALLVLSSMSFAQQIEEEPDLLMSVEETKMFEQIIEDRISDGDKLEFRWIHQTLNNDWKKFFGLCACHFTVDVSSSTTTGGRRTRYAKEKRRETESVAAEDIVIFSTEETKVKITTKEFHILIYAEFENGNIVFKFINFPLDEPDFRYMPNVEYNDFVKAERKDFEEKVKDSNSLVYSYKEKIETDLNELKETKVSVVGEDDQGNPIWMYDRKVKPIIDGMIEKTKTLITKILLFNDRNSLHRKLFEDYDENAFSGLKKMHEEIDPLLEEAKTFMKVELEARKEEAMKAYWKDRHEKEREKENGETIDRIRKELSNEAKKARQKNSSLLSDVMMYDVGIKKSDLEDLFKQNALNARATVDFVEKCLDEVDLKKDVVKVNDIIGEVHEEEKDDSHDFRPITELRKIAETEVDRLFTKTEKELKEEDRRAVLKKHKRFKEGAKITIEYAINGRTYKFVGLYKNVGPGKISVGTKIVTLNDLPYELQACLKGEKEFNEFIESEIKKYPVMHAYEKQKEQEIQKLTYKMLMKQFEENLQDGYVFMDGFWFTSHELASIFLLKNMTSNQ